MVNVMLASTNLYALRDRIQDRMLAKIEKRGAGVQAAFYAGVWCAQAAEKLREGQRYARAGDPGMARRYFRLALRALAIANRRTRGSYELLD